MMVRNISAPRDIFADGIVSVYSADGLCTYGPRRYTHTSKVFAECNPWMFARTMWRGFAVMGPFWTLSAGVVHWRYSWSVLRYICETHAYFRYLASVESIVLDCAQLHARLSMLCVSYLCCTPYLLQCAKTLYASTSNCSKQMYQDRMRILYTCFIGVTRISERKIINNATYGICAYRAIM